MTGRASTLLDLALIIASFALWSSAFVTLYGLNGVGCASGWDQVMTGPFSVLRIGLIAVWAVHLAAGAALALWSWRRRATSDDMFASGASALSIAALIATFGTGAPTLGLAMCR